MAWEPIHGARRSQPLIGIPGVNPESTNHTSVPTIEGKYWRCGLIRHVSPASHSSAPILRGNLLQTLIRRKAGPAQT